MLSALIFTLLTGGCFASISVIVSRLAHSRISFFRFLALSNLLASAAAWILLSDRAQIAGAGWGRVLPFAAAVGMINTASQAAFALSLRWGHNGVSLAIRNSAAMISMLAAAVFLHETLHAVNVVGAAVVLLSLAELAVFGKGGSVATNWRKWIPAVTASLLLSGSYQSLMTASVLLPEGDRAAGVLVPCLLGFCGVGNLLAAAIERRLARERLPLLHGFDAGVWKTMCAWSGIALLQYFLLIHALEAGRAAGIAALTWPLLIGVNVTAFSLFCRFRWKEKYPPATVVGMAGCVLGLVLIIWGRK